MNNENEEEERYLYENIRMIQDSYQKMIQPYIDRLVYLKSLRPMPQTMIISKEQAAEIGLHLIE